MTRPGGQQLFLPTPKIVVYFWLRLTYKYTMNATSTETKMKTRNLLSARFEVRADGLKNSARFTKETANRLAQTLRTQGCSVKVVEHSTCIG